MKNIQLNDEIIEDLGEEKVNQLDEILLNTQEQCQMVEQMIRSQIQVKDAMIDKLHKELEYYKQDQAERFVVQLMKAIVKVRKDMGKLIRSEKWPELTGEELRKEYIYSFEDLTDLLQQQNIDPFETEVGACFDASKHQIFKIESTDNPLLDKTIQKSVSEGYVKGDKVLIAERVIVYQNK